MTLSSFICVYLISCYTLPLTRIIEDCPQNCDCYEAPEDDTGENTAITLDCNLRGGEAEINQAQFDPLSTKMSINTLVINEITKMTQMDEKMPPELRISNIVFSKCTLSQMLQYNENPGPFITPNSLRALTFDETIFIDDQFNWEMFNSQDELKSIQFTQGKLTTIEDMFAIENIPVQNVISLTVHNTQLRTIKKDAFKYFGKLQMLKITANQIEKLDWLNEIPSSSFWNLDLRDNKISDFPHDVAVKFGNLKTLELGGNEIHVLPVETADILINRLREFSFEPINGNNKYFYPTKKMTWLLNVHEKTKYSKLPGFLHESLEDYKCIKDWGLEVKHQCTSLREDQFKYPETANSEHLAVVADGYGGSFSYWNKQVKLTGAVLPTEWRSGDLWRWLNKLVSPGSNSANVVKFYLNMDTWFTTKQDNKDEFDRMIQGLETDLKLAEDMNIFVIINLWKFTNLPDAFLHERILPVYLEDHLTPLVDRLNKFKSLGAWDILEEPENLVMTNKPSAEECHNTMNIQRTHGGEGRFEISKVQNFIAQQAQIIHRSEPRKLVTITMGENFVFNPNKVGFNHFEDKCLSKALNNDCPNNDCALNFYTLIINGGNVKKGKPFNPLDVSEKSPKPVIVISDADPNRAIEILDKSEETWLWKLDGILATFKSNILDNQISDAILSYASKFDKPLIGPKNIGA